ncbi:MAG: Crp/Fnr family transcriptional regulator, partial [Muribaculaceae bacterium]|nr:Crp/Fnr family transcriptional regulator [Muribaculaceae bacterium]
LRHFRRGEYFIHSGSVMREVGWIVKGAFKHSLIDESGNTKAVGFVFEEAVLANYISAMLGRTMPTDIIALEESDVYIVPVNLMRERLLYDPTLNISFIQALFEQAYGHILNDYRLGPEQRYIQLKNRFPRIFDLVSLGEIASYLNISRRQLYRIRDSVEAKIDE